MSLPINLITLFFLLFLLFYFPSFLIAQNTTPNKDYLKLQLIHIKHSKSLTHTLLLDTSRVSALHRHLKSPLVSGASVGSGQYFAGLSIGTPPQKLLLVADTGSDLTWVKCSACRDDCAANHPPGSTFLARHSASFSLAHCFDPVCRLVPSTAVNGDRHCDSRHRSHAHTPCRYEYSYADGSTTLGLLARETTSLNTSSGREVRHRNLKFGCGFRTSGPAASPSGAFEGASGVMGLGRGPISFAAQLGRKFGNKFSYCLVDYTLSPPPTSYLVIGGIISRNSNLQSTPLISSTLSPTFYYIGIQSVIIDGKKLPISSSVWALDDLGNGGTVIDSGTTLSFVPEPAYRQIISAMKSRVKLPPLSESTQGFDLCYNVSGASHPSFPKLSFVLVGDSVFDPPPSNYFIDTAEDVKCLALQPVASASGFSVIGNLMQQGFLFEFDNEKSQLFFTRNGCGIMS